MARGVLITGGGKRIGAAIAFECAKSGWDIALHYRSSRKDAEGLADRIEGMERSCRLFQADFGDMAQVMRLIPDVLESMPQVNVLVNSVSLFRRATMMETTESLFDDHFQVNLKTPFFLSQAFANRVRDGHIVNILDTKVSKHAIRYFAYSLTKKSLAEFTCMAARELGPAIRVNAVAPGLILPSAGTSRDAFENMGKKIPLKQTGNPDDIAQAVLFLLQSRFITGECIFVDGGERLM